MKAPRNQLLHISQNIDNITYSYRTVSRAQANASEVPMPEKVLVVDDEKDLVELVDYNLKKEGYTVLTTGDGLEALKLAARESPDLVVLDIMLPGMQGLDVLKNLKKKSETSSTPVILLTAKSEELDKVLGLELGADDYVTKPFSPRELVARVKAVLRRVSSAGPAGVRK